MRRILIDTSVYVDWFRARRHEDIIAGHRGAPSLSAVVAMELIAGARKGEKLGKWTERFQRSRRLLVPGWEVWKLTGQVLHSLGARGAGGMALTNDVLIAMTARVGGLKVFTKNREDFMRIAAIQPFDLEVVT